MVWLIQALLEIRHATALTTGAKHWHRQKAVFYVFCFGAPSIYPLNHSFAPTTNYMPTNYLAKLTHFASSTILQKSYPSSPYQTMQFASSNSYPKTRSKLNTLPKTEKKTSDDSLACSLAALEQTRPYPEKDMALR